MPKDAKCDQAEGFGGIMIKKLYKFIIYPFVFSILIFFLHQIMLLASNNYLAMAWEYGREMNRGDILVYVKKATDMEIKWLLDKMLPKEYGVTFYCRIFLNASERDKCGAREMRIVYGVANDKRFAGDIREATLVPMCMVTNQANWQVLKNIAEDESDPISKSAQQYLLKYYQ